MFAGAPPLFVIGLGLELVGALLRLTDVPEVLSISLAVAALGLWALGFLDLAARASGRQRVALQGVVFLWVALFVVSQRSHAIAVTVVALEEVTSIAVLWWVGRGPWFVAVAALAVEAVTFASLHGSVAMRPPPAMVDAARIADPVLLGVLALGAGRAMPRLALDPGPSARALRRAIFGVVLLALGLAGVGSFKATAGFTGFGCLVVGLVVYRARGTAPWLAAATIAFEFLAFGSVVLSMVSGTLDASSSLVAGVALVAVIAFTAIAAGDRRVVAAAVATAVFVAEAAWIPELQIVCALVALLPATAAIIRASHRIAERSARIVSSSVG